MATRGGITYWGFYGIFANGLKHILRGWCCVKKLPIAMGDQYIYKIATAMAVIIAVVIGITMAIIIYISVD